MILLDVNVLLALCFAGHPFHGRVAKWAAALIHANRADFVTCAITELGVVRIGPNARYCPDVAAAQAALDALKRSRKVAFTFVPDDLDATRLPRWVRRADDTTDGHLTELALRVGANFATLDKRIPGAIQVP